MTTATELITARIVSNIRKDQIIRAELDQAREYVETVATAYELRSKECKAVEAELDDLRKLLDDAEALIDELNADNAELRRMCEIVERVIGERDRARDLAVRAGAFDDDRSLIIIGQLQEDIDTLGSELEIMQRERDQALYERDSARAAVDGA